MVLVSSPTPTCSRWRRTTRDASSPSISASPPMPCRTRPPRTSPSYEPPSAGSDAAEKRPGTLGLQEVGELDQCALVPRRAGELDADREPVGGAAAGNRDPRRTRDVLQ